MKIYLARQPVFNRKKHVVGYELLFRDSEKNCFPVGVPGDVGTAKLLINSFLNMDIERIVGNKTALINFPVESLRSDLPALLPNEKIVIELLETIEPNDENLEIIKTLYLKGYRIALDDFVYSDKWQPFFKYINIIKFDIRETPPHEIAYLLPELKKKGIHLLAEKVETHDEYKQCRAIGFDFFQGYFFSKPEMLSANEAAVTNYTIMQVYYEAIKPEINFNKIATLFSRESTLAYQLLKLVNNVATSRFNNEIANIKQALVYLGEYLVRRFACMLVTGSLGKNKPLELVKLAFVRSLFCDRIARHTEHKHQKEDLFLVGLFSTMDALLDTPMETAMTQIPVSADVKNCLIHRQGPYTKYLYLAEALEQGDWELIKMIEQELNIDPSVVINCYKNAISWEERHLSQVIEPKVLSSQLDI
jgi:EAL and modified HD-GYP domain-containing signal transduction protein